MKIGAAGLALALFCAGCVPHRTALPKPVASDTKYQVTLSTQPKALRQLDPTQMIVQATDKSGKPVTGASVRVQFAMPTMDMGRNEVALHEAKTLGTYMGTGRFTMPGDWQATVQISKNGWHTEKTVPLTVR